MSTRERLDCISLLSLNSVVTYTFLIAVITSLPFLLLFYAVPYAHDLNDHLAMSAQFSENFKEGNYFPRWYGDFNNGWGEPTGIFYPPGLPASSSLTTWLLGGNHLAGLFTALWIFTFIGGIGLARLATKFTDKKYALIALLIWIIIPFRAFELYASGLYSFYAAGSLLPWVLLSIKNLSDNDRKTLTRDLITWSALYALIILINLPYALMMTFLIAVWVMVDAMLNRSLQVVIKIVAGGVIGVSLAAWYLLPSLLELKNITIPHSGDIPIFETNFIFQSAGSWMPISLKRDFDHMALYQIVAITLSVAIIIVLSKPGYTKGKFSSQGSIFTLLLVFGFISFIMSTIITAPLWRILPILHHVNLPWRFLEIMTIPMAIMITISIQKLLNHVDIPNTQQPSQNTRMIIYISLILVLVVNLFQSNNFYHLNRRIDDNQLNLFDSEKIYQRFYRSKGFFLPKSAKEPKSLLDYPAISILGSGTQVKLIDWKITERKLRIKSVNESQISLRTYYYPGWAGEYIKEGVVYPLDLKADSASGAILITVPRGEGFIRIYFDTILYRSIGFLITILTIITLIFMIFIKRKH